MGTNGEYRPYRYLRPTKSCSVPYRVICVDTETLPDPDLARPGVASHRLHLGVAASVRFRSGRPSEPEWFTFHSPRSFWAWVYDQLDPRHMTWIVAHNAGFDLSVLQFWLEVEAGIISVGVSPGPLGPEVEGGAGWSGLLVLDDPPLIIQGRADAGPLVIVDSLNYYRCSLEQLGRDLGVPKLPMPDFGASTSDWATYCHRDTLILLTAMRQLIQWWAEEGLGRWRYTASGLAYEAWRHRFMRARVLVHGHGPTLHLEREGYYGGENRIWYVGEIESQDRWLQSAMGRLDGVARVPEIGPIYHLDVRSHYPYVMRYRTYPARLVDYRETCDLSTLSELLISHGVIAHVLLHSDTNTYPVRVSGQTTYATGRYWTVLCGPELQYAMQSGHVIDVTEVAIYDLEDLFSRYVSYFWSKRSQAIASTNGSTDLLCKTLLNALYGRFGLRAQRWVSTPDVPSPTPWGHWHRVNLDTRQVDEYRSVAWHTQQRGIPGEGQDSCPAISAYVTSHGRRYMAGLRHIAGDRNVYYQDTDSLHVTEQGYRRLQAQEGLIGEDLGQLRLVARHESGCYYGLKDYRLGDVRTCGAVSRRARWGPDGSVTQEEFMSGAALRQGRRDGIVEVRTVIKRDWVPCVPGTVGAGGWVSPPRLGGNHGQG